MLYLQEAAGRASHMTVISRTHDSVCFWATPQLHYHVQKPCKIFTSTLVSSVTPRKLSRCKCLYLTPASVTLCLGMYCDRAVDYFLLLLVAINMNSTHPSVLRPLIFIFLHATPTTIWCHTLSFHLDSDLSWIYTAVEMKFSRLLWLIFHVGLGVLVLTSGTAGLELRYSSTVGPLRHCSMCWAEQQLQCFVPTPATVTTCYLPLPLVLCTAGSTGDGWRSFPLNQSAME